MSTVSKPYTFSPNTTASSSQVNANFDTLYNDYNGGISANNLAANAVTTAKIADSNVTTAKIADSNVTTEKLNDAAVTPAKLLAGTGTTWPWATWTPTFTNITVGSGTVSAFYKQIGKTVTATIAFTYGAGSAVGSNPTISLPVTAAARYTGTGAGQYMIGTIYIEDAGVNAFSGIARIGSTTTFSVFGELVSGTYSNLSGLSSTVPFTWGTGDFFCGTITYEAA